MVDALAIDLGERFWVNKSAFTRILFKVVLEPGSTLHAVRLKTARSERLITVVMDKTQKGVVRPSSQVSSPTGAFDLPGLSGIVSTPGWSGTTSEGKPFYWRQIYIAESDPVTVTLDNAAIEEYTEVVVPYDPNFPYVFTEYSGKGEWVSCIGQFGGGNLAELVRRTSGTTEGSETMTKGGGTMPWLSIIMAILSFFAAGGANKESRGKAALIAAGVGAATYYTTHETEWGQENLGRFDGVEMDVDANGNVTASTSPTKKPVKIPSTGTTADSGAGGFWNTVGAWLKSPAGQVTTGAAGAKTLGAPNWLVWGGVALGAYLILKD